jgi:excisionase family DNA binding protein
MNKQPDPNEPTRDDCSTIEAARWLGMAVRSIQLMVDRGELRAWKTPGGHRRISRASIEAWLAQRASTGTNADLANKPSSVTVPRLLLIEDSSHFQNLVKLLVQQTVPNAQLHIADDGIAGLAMAGKLEPQLLIVDILLPGIDGATLITSLRSHPQFKNMALIVVTSLDSQDRAPYDFALQGVPVIHKTQLVAELPQQLRAWGQRLGFPIHLV